MYILQWSHTGLATLVVAAHVHIHPSIRLYYHFSNCVRNEAATSEIFLTLLGIERCVDVLQYCQ